MQIFVLLVEMARMRVKTSPVQNPTVLDTDPMLGYCWSSVYHAGPTLSQHWVHIWCLLGMALISAQHTRRRPNIDPTLV